MNKKEFAVFASALRTYYPKEQILPNEQSMTLWYNQLNDIPYELAEVALNKWVALEKWSPTIADIRKMSNEIVNVKARDWGEAWEQVEKAIHHYGVYNAEKALESFDDLTRQAVKRLGFNNLCMSETPQVERANFRMIYEQLAERKTKDDQIPERLKQLINQMPLMIGGNEGNDKL